MLPNSSSTITLTAADGHQLSAYRVLPHGKAVGALVVIQEVFGVNHHIRAVCDDFAARDFTVIAPALFDRIERGVELGYGEADLVRGRELRTALGWDKPLLDVAAALKEAGGSGLKTAVIGFCWGGSLAWLSATRLHPVCTVCYYGGQIVQFKDETPHCPVLMHFGARDTIITPEDYQAIRAAQPGVEMHVYPTGHGFNCPERADYDPESARLALRRTLAFLGAHLI